MSKRLTLLKSAAFAIGFASAAYAQPPLEVYETQGGRTLGRLAQAGLLARDYGGNGASPVYLNLANNALAVNAIFFFTSRNCSGKAYSNFWWDATSEPHSAQFDGVDIWTSDTNLQVINANSYSWFWDGPNAKVSPQCGTGSWQVIVANPVKLETAPQWAPSCIVNRLGTTSYSGDAINAYICKPILTVK
jgi:hypothetical protein